MSISVVNGGREDTTIFLDSEAADAALERAMAAMARVEADIDRLWHDLLTVESPHMSDRLVDARRALNRAARLLSHDATIG